VQLKAKPRTIAFIVVLAAFVVLVVDSNRGITPYSGANIATFLVVGLSLGGIYAISACGLVVTYSTTGIFNFAHGAIGCFLAFLYWELRINRHWPAPLALFVVIFVVAPLIGVTLDKVLMQRLRNATLIVQLMVTVGVMLTFMGVTETIWQPNTGRSLPHFFESSPGVRIDGVTATWHRIITVVLAAAIAFILRAFLYRTRLGIAMRAVVDNRSLAGLSGARPGVISGASWALGCMTAAIAGILIAPETGLVVENLTLVVVIAFAAAAIAQLKSVPWALAGGLIVGLASGFADEFVSFGRDWQFAPDAIPPAILLIAVLFLPQARLETGKVRLTRRTERLTKPWEALAGALAMVGLVVAWANGWIPWFWGTHFGQRTPVWLGRGTEYMVMGVIMLSLIPLTGWAGQVSFANFAIAGFGAAMYAKVGGQNGDPMGIVWVVLMCAPLGVLVAIPALRLKGLYLALASVAFADLADFLLFRHPDIINPAASGNLYKPLQLFGFRISTNAPDRKAFFIFMAISFGAIFFGLEMLRRTRWARRWIAIADSPAAAATVGVNLTLSKIVVFAISGAIAGYAGTMLGLSTGALQVDSFPFFAGLPLVLLLAVNGVRYPVAAFLGVISLASFEALYEVFHQPTILVSVALIGPGLAAVAMAYRPEGTVFYAGRDLAGLLPWRKDAREERAIAAAKAREEDVTLDEIGDLGLARPFTSDKVAQLDRVLNVAEELSRQPTAGASRA
jgi:branched-chain amino acid transport system permease protein